MNSYADLILVAVGIALQILFRVPALDTWYNLPKFDGWRGWMMAGFSLAVTSVMFGLSCTPLYVFVPCTTETVWQLLRDWGILFAGNQLMYLTLDSSPAKKLRAS